MIDVHRAGGEAGPSPSETILTGPNVTDVVHKVRKVANSLGVSRDSIWLSSLQVLLRKLRYDRDASAPVCLNRDSGVINVPLNMCGTETIKSLWQDADRLIDKAEPGPDHPDVLITTTSQASTIDNMTELCVSIDETAHAIILRANNAMSGIDVTAIAKHLFSLTNTMCTDPQQLVENLTLVAPQELNESTQTWNNTTVERPAALLHHDFEKHAANQPNAEAVVGQHRLSYAQVNENANRLAHHLVKRGVVPGDRIGICVDRDADLIVAILAVLKSGAAYVPMDPAFPAERLAFLLADSASRLVITDNSYGSFEELEAVNLHTDANDIASESSEPLLTAVTPEHDAYIIYTSGTTGTPKGVPIQHKQAADRLQTMRELYETGTTDRVLQFASTTFDASVEQIFTALGSGAALVVRPDSWSIESLLNQLVAENVTVAEFPPPVWEVVTQSLIAGDSSLPDSLRCVVLGGDRVKPSAVALWFKHFDIPLFNTYGPTETTITATARKIVNDEENVTIGLPVANVAAHVMDAFGQPVPVGVAGELWLSGPGTARGYLDRPELTAERFVSLPDILGGQYAYRTGDLTRRQSNGELEFLGRIDDQVKIGGIRIEPSEISSILLGHPSVAQAHVEVRVRQSDNILVSHVVPGDHRKIPSARQLRDFLSDKLPKALIPSYFNILESMPLLPNGKVDRRTLATISVIPTIETGDHVPPAPGVETRIAAYWAEELGLDKVGATDDLLALGAHSLRTMRIAVRIGRSENVDLSVGELLAAPTIQAQAKLVASKSDGPRRFPPVETIESARAPMSEQQKQIWFLSSINPEDTSYRFQASTRIVGSFDQDVLDRALTELHRRHSVLRTTYSEDAEGFWQHVHPAVEVRAHRIDVRGVPDTDRPRIAATHVAEAIATPFDLAELPLQKWTTVQLADNEYDLILVESHMVHDGWAFALLMKELKDLYNAFLRGEPSPLPEPTVSYGDYSAWQQRELRDGGSLSAQLHSWREHLSDIPDPLSLHTDHPRPALMRHEGGNVRVDIPGGLPEKVRAFCRANRVTLFEALFGAFSVLLYRHTGQQRLCVGSAFANRRVPDTQDIVGMFVNAVLLRADVNPGTSFVDLLNGVHQELQRAEDAQELPFPEIVQAVNPDRSAATNPFTQVMFSAHDSAFCELEFGDATGTISYPPNQSAKFDLNVIVLPAGESRIGNKDTLDQRITMEWEYNSILFDESTIARMTQRYLVLLDQLISQPQAPVSELDMLTGDEQKLMLDDWQPKTRLEADNRAVDQVYSWAQRAPEAIAVKDDHSELTYRDLTKRADQLAHTLVKRGIGREAVVGVVTKRGIDLPVACLAIHRVGAAYLPIDPSTPVDRIAFILEDSGAELVLCSESTTALIDGATVSSLVIEQSDDGDAMDSLATPQWETVENDLAYIIYTSGSTGTPKGVMVEQKSLAQLLEWSQNEFPLRPNAITPLIASQSFDASVWELWRTLISGATCYIAPDHIRTSPDELVSWLRESRVTHCFVPTPLGNYLIRHHSLDLPDLTWMGVGGDQLTLPLGATLPWDVANLYGPTEATVIATSYLLPRGTVIDTDSVTPPIGSPRPGCITHIVDKSGKPVPIGVPGELLISGDCVGRGYRNRPELTTEAFAETSTSRCYRTGDLVRWNHNGTIEFLGRTDSQVKIRGYRIELGEIEVVLREIANIVDCAVTTWKRHNADVELAAYVIAADGSELTAEYLRSSLKDRLPDYMIPAVFVQVDDIPLSVNGKIDTDSLPDPAGHHIAHTVGQVAPRDPIEKLIADIWSEALGLDGIGAFDNFFDLGGHSLLATRLVNQLEHRTGIRISLREIYESPTVAAMKTALLDRIGAEH